MQKNMELIQNMNLPAKSKDELSNKHKDKFIQTILKPKELERKASLYKKTSKNCINRKRY